MLQKNLDYVIDVLQGKKPSFEPDWFELIGFLYCHKVVGLFYNRAMNLGVELPMKVETILRERFEKQSRKVKLLRRHIALISYYLLENKAEHCFLKGSVLSNISDKDLSMYVDGERCSNDIDILVAPTGITKVCNILTALGYTQGTYDVTQSKIVPYSRKEILMRRMNRGEVAPFLKLTNDKEFPFVEVDVNFSLGNTPNEGAALLKEILRNTNVYEGKVHITVPEKELFFLHLVMHQYKESSVYFAVHQCKELDLYKLADMYYILKSGYVNVGRIQTLTREYNLAEKMGAVLAQIGEVFNDQEILEEARECGDRQPKVIDYEVSKQYEWATSVKARIRQLSSESFLRETND